MTKVDMSRRCSHCGHNGHNSRTCPERGLKLFGVRISTDGFMRKSVSMGNLSAAAAQNPPCSTPEHSESAGDGGYVSDGLVQTSNSRERKKGVPWTEEEHKLFLVGLQKLGKGDWRGISRNFVTSRTPTQVASHAQKYFLRQSNLNKRKRRSSLFDIPADAVEEPRRRIPELRLGSNNATAGAGSGSFAESTGSPVSVGVPVPVAAAFTVPEAPLGFPPCLSLGRSSTAEESAAAAAAYLKMAEQTYWKAPAPQISGSIPTQDLASSCSFTGTAKEETEDEESFEERGLSLSIAPPCVEDASSGRAQKQKHQQQQHSSFHTGQLGPKSSAISVV